MTSGVGATIMLGAVWWHFARDRHSTTSLRPALVGWLALPAIVAGLIITERQMEKGRQPFEPRDFS